VAAAQPARRPAVTEYVVGVGTGHLLDRLRGGLTGAGLSRALLRSYRFLVERYVPGDRISLFGFSRGAYTARSLAGMIGRIGIVDRTGLSRRELRAAVRQAYQRYTRLRAEHAYLVSGRAEMPRARAASSVE
jgi:uncharacterized protein (DUF2235 family)